MEEDYRFLDLHGECVLVAHHRSARPTSRAIVMCHPLGEEKLWAHRVFVSFARDLATAGFDVLRFDFRGEGDSDREFEQSTFDTRIQDTCLAIDTVYAENPSIAEVTLLGLRLGASVAAAAAIRRTDVARLVLWDPVVDGASFMQTFLRVNLMYQMAVHRKVIENREALVARLVNGETVNIEGYELAESLFRQVSEFRLADVLTQFMGETLVLQINQSDAPVKQELSALATDNSRCRVLAVLEEQFWKENKLFCRRSEALTKATIDWLTAPA